MDAESFKNRFLPFHQKLYRVAYRLLENEADAEDLVQEAYLKLWNKRGGLVIINNPEAFCVTLVKNMCLDMLRSGKYSMNRQTLELTGEYEATHADDSEIKDDAQQLKAIIAELPELQKKIVVLRDLQEYSYEDIERLTGLHSVNIRVLLSRARKKIREKYTKLNNYENRGN